MAKRLLAILLLGWAVAACGGRSAERHGAGHARSADAEGPSERSTRGGEPTDVDAFSRSLDARATWRDVVALARRLDERRADSSDAGCLLAGDATRGFRLAANLAVSVRPLHAPEGRLVEAVAASAAIVSRWGTEPSATMPGGRIVADFTLTRPPAPSAVHVVLGVAQETLVLALGGRVGEPSASELPDRLRAMGASYVHVVAEPDVPVSRIASVLDALDRAGVEIALAVFLPDGARAPEAQRAGGDGPALCADGLPEPTGDTTPPDTRELSSIRSSLGPLRQAAERCQSEAMSSGIGAVELLVALRVEPDGSVPDACVVEESRPAGALRRCLVAAARAIAFPPSATRGPLVLELPFSLRTSETAAQRGRCR